MSVFLQRPEADHVAANALAFAIRDGFPVSQGHTLVIPRRLVATWFEATREEQVAILELVDGVKAQLDAEFHPDGYNIGINAGLAAGQTVMHLHVHLIPRYSGDVPDPRGGVRHLMPGKGNYLAKEFKPAGARAEALATGGAEDPFYQHLLPLFAKATDVAILAAFSQHRGVEELEPLVLAAADRGARVRLMTGDYLNITQRTALEALLAWTAREDPAPGALTPEVRIVETARLTTSSRSFHPKAWCFEGRDFAVAFVGSSNVSRAALFDGVEWNLRIDRERDRDGHARVIEAFEQWWQWARPLDQAFLDGYRDRPAPYLAEPAELPAEPLESPPRPHPIQTQALAELAEARQRGRGRTLVVMATGLGKTWLAAFDALQLAAELGRAPRILFLAHRDELLRQAARTLRRAFPEASQGFYAGSQNNLGAQMVFASVQKLCRPSALALLQAERFDYAVVDEVHHATADSYRRVLAGDGQNPSGRLPVAAQFARRDPGLRVARRLGDPRVEAISRNRFPLVALLGRGSRTGEAPLPWAAHQPNDHQDGSPPAASFGIIVSRSQPSRQRTAARVDEISTVVPGDAFCRSKAGNNSARMTFWPPKRGN